MLVEAPDKETGAACMACASIFAGEYVKAAMLREEEVDHTEQLNYLRNIWNAGRQNSLG